MSKGQAYCIMEQNDTVLDTLREAYEAEPENTEAVIRLAQHYSDRGWLNEAIEIFKEALQRRSQDFTLHLEYGNTCFKKQEFKEALQVFKKLTELKPERIEGWNNLVIVQLQVGETESAKISFGKVLRIEPDHPGALINMGNYHFSNGDYENARLFFEHAVQTQPDFADAWFNLGNTFIALESYESAQNAFEKALKYQREFPSALKNLGFVFEKAGKLDKAEASYLQALEINKADASLWANLGAVSLRMKKYDEAKKYFLKAVRLAPNEIGGWMGLRHLSLVKGDLNTFIRSTLAILPRLSDEILAQSIEILYELNQFNKAEEILLQADRLGRDGDALDLQRLLLYQRKKINPGKVIAIYKRLSNLPKLTDPIRKGLARYALESAHFDTAINFVNNMEKADAAAESILWRALLGKNEVSKAKQLIQNYIKDNPDGYDCWFLLARIEAQRGNRIRAEKFLIRALENGFTNMEELNESVPLKQIFDTLALAKEQFSN